jgi:hypothetical protein
MWDVTRCKIATTDRVLARFAGFCRRQSVPATEGESHSGPLSHHAQVVAWVIEAKFRPQNPRSIDLTLQKRTDDVANIKALGFAADS